MWIVIRVLAVLWCVLASPGNGPAHAEKRLALSVGIDVYDNLPAHEQLKKAVKQGRRRAIISVTVNETCAPTATLPT